jgi:citrate synthase
MSQPDKPWWRARPLSHEEANLMWALARAHHASAFRENPSTVAVANAAFASLDIGKAIGAGILTLGGRHAPLEQTIELLILPFHELEEKVIQILTAGQKVPGWGGSYQKEAPDPLWAPVASQLSALAGPGGVVDKMRLVTSILHQRSITVHPNPSAYTAASSILLALPPKLAVYLFIAARLAAWAEIASRQISEME